MDNNLAIVVIPVFEPLQGFPALVKKLQSETALRIIVVDDGSKSDKKGIFHEISGIPHVKTLTHPQNQGKGSALKTGFRYVLENVPSVKTVNQQTSLLFF